MSATSTGRPGGSASTTPCRTAPRSKVVACRVNPSGPSSRSVSRRTSTVGIGGSRAEAARDDLVGVMAGRERLGHPPGPQVLRGGVEVLGGPGGQAGRLSRLAPRATGRQQGLLDLGGALGEQPSQRPRHSGDLRGAPGHVVPAHPEPLGELPTQHGLVQVPGGLAVPVQRLGVQGRPPAVHPLDQVGQHHVGVQLRVPGPAGGVLERGPEEAVRLDARARAGRRRDGPARRTPSCAPATPRPRRRRQRAPPAPRRPRPVPRTPSAPTPTSGRRT